MKNRSNIIYQHLIITFLLFFAQKTVSQSNQWTSTVKVGGTPQLADWVFDVITTEEKNYFAVGFAKENEANPADWPDVPAYCLLSPNGRLIGDGVIELPHPDEQGKVAQGRLYNVVETPDAYFAVGCSECFGSSSKGILVKVDKSTLSSQNWLLLPSQATSARLNDISYVDNNGDRFVLVSGWALDGSRKKWVAAYNLDGTLRNTNGAPHELVSAESGEVGAMTHEVTADGKVRIYTAASLLRSISSDSNLPMRRVDTDVQINTITYDAGNATLFTEAAPLAVSSITSRAYSSPGTNGPIALGSDDIFLNFPPKFPNGQYDKYPYGPKYLGTPFSRDFPNCNETSPVQGLLYVEDWSDGSDDLPYSIVKSGNRLVVSALLNRLIMWGRGSTGTNLHLGNDDISNNQPPISGLSCIDGGPCNHYDSEGYYWGEAYLLFFDLDGAGIPSALSKATYLGTMSGGDFIPKVVQTSDGGFAVSGTVTGCPDGLEPVEGAEHMMIMKTDANGELIWREHYNGPSEGACGFAITESPDGGLVVAGNTEGGGEEDYCFIKVGSDCAYDGATILPNTPGTNDYVLAGDETWGTDQLVKARVIVPAGKKLVIKGASASARITVRFADSKEAFDFKDRVPLGITVQKGGYLSVSNAVLRGYDCNGTEKMWDGINVEGDPALTQTNINQGFAIIIGSDILNARQGIAATAVWCSSTTQDDAYAGTGSLSSTQTSTLEHGGPFGGGRIFGANSRWIDNKRSAIFMQYPHNWNTSRFINCEFLSNGPLADPAEMLATNPYNFNDNEPRGTSIHVSIWSTRVQFSGCDFTGSTGIVPDFRPFGIAGDDPKIVASGGAMTDLKVGIECRSPLGSALGSVNASGINFTNVVQGVNLRNSTADIVQSCQFNAIPAPNTFQGLSPTGIFGEGNKGALIRFNQFLGADASKPSWGIVERNTLSQGCEIRENEFSASRIGNQFEGNNARLTAACNDYTAMGFSGWSVLPVGATGVLPDQGSPFLNQPKADNEFFDFCDGSSDLHIYSELAFNYFDKTGNPHPADEDCVSDIVNLDKANSPSSSDCFVPDPPCPNPPCDRLAQYYASPGTVRDRNIAIRGLIHTGQDAEGLDLDARYEDVLSLLQTRNQTEDRILRTGTLAALGRYAEAQAVNNTLVGADPEISSYRAYMDNILAAGTGVDALPEQHYLTALTSLNAENVSARLMAQNLQQLREDIYLPLVALNPEVGAQYRAMPIGQTVVQAAPKAVLAAPNPFHSQIAFDLSGMEAARLVITDLMGRSVLVRSVQGMERYVWYANGLADGAYNYQVWSQDRLLQSGKLLKTKGQ
jgi:hypothetical protein